MDGGKTFIAGRLMRKILFCMAIFIIAIVLQERSAFAASNLEEGVGQLAQQISKSMEEKQKQKIAITDFSDLNGNVTALGQFMAVIPSKTFPTVGDKVKINGMVKNAFVIGDQSLTVILENAE